MRLNKLEPELVRPLAALRSMPDFKVLQKAMVADYLHYVEHVIGSNIDETKVGYFRGKAAALQELLDVINGGTEWRKHEK